MRESEEREGLLVGEMHVDAQTQSLALANQATTLDYQHKGLQLSDARRDKRRRLDRSPTLRAWPCLGGRHGQCSARRDLRHAGTVAGTTPAEPVPRRLDDSVVVVVVCAGLLLENVRSKCADAMAVGTGGSSELATPLLASDTALSVSLLVHSVCEPCQERSHLALTRLGNEMNSKPQITSSCRPAKHLLSEAHFGRGRRGSSRGSLETPIACLE